MMTNNNFIITYVSNGFTKFDFTFSIKNETELQVFIDNKLQVLYLHYDVYIETDTNYIIMKSPVGSHSQSCVVALVYNPSIQRETNFNNATQIKAQQLNDEFNNLINLQTYLQDNLSCTIKVFDDSLYNLVFPNYEAGKSIIWNNNTFMNSYYNSDEQLNILLTFMQDVKNGVYNVGNGNNGEGNNGEGEYQPTDPKLIDSKDVVYSANYVFADNVEQAINMLSDPINLTYIDSNLNVANVKEALDALKLSNNISYTKNAINTNVSNELSNLDNKINDIVSGNTHIELNNFYMGCAHCIVESSLDNDGLTNHIIQAGENTISIVEPLTIAFSYQNTIKIASLSANQSLVLPLNQICYIYATLNNDNSISFGYSTDEPRYLYFNPVIKPQSNLLLLNRYNNRGDFFYIPSLTMFNNTGSPLKRVYIGQVKFKSDKSLDFINNYVIGNSYSFDIPISIITSNINKEYLKKNRLGTDLLSTNKYFKSRDNFVSGTIGVYEKYSYEFTNGTFNTANTSYISSTISCNFSSQEVWGVVGTHAVNALLFNRATGVSDSQINTPYLPVEGFARLILKRVF